MRLLAKSLPARLTTDKSIPESATLFGHAKQCVDVADVLIQHTAEAMVWACGINDDQQVEWFRRALRWCAVAHDLGKATKKFQSVLRHTHEPPHWVRHEVVSYWMLKRHVGLAQAVEESFSDLGEWAVAQIRLLHVAILGHHLKFPRHGQPLGYDESPITILWSDLISDPTWDLVCEVAGRDIRMTEDMPAIEGNEDWLMDEVVIPYQDALNEPLPSHILMLGSMLRGALIAVDTLGSVRADTTHFWELWKARLHTAFSREILWGALERSIETRLGGEINPEVQIFQEQGAHADADVVIVKAGCGSGKTILALRRAQVNEVCGLVMTAPTTAVASQTFADYGRHIGEAAQLIHSRSAVDIELLETPQDGGTFGSEQSVLAEQYEALERLVNPITFCTVDLVAGVLINRRASLALLPRLAVSQIVFDEAHLYDSVLFSHVLTFLRKFHIPVLIMTASLPSHMEALIREAASGRRVTVIEGPKGHERLPRYNIQLLSEGQWNTVVENVKASVERGEKVLFVANTVAWSVEWFEQLSERLGNAHVALLHSHFKYEDRVRIQDRIVESFRAPGIGFCAVTTQICEVSFDVSVDLLISHVAPFPAIIQRLGRLNRRAKPGDPCRTAQFIDPPAQGPYRDSELEAGRTILHSLIRRKAVGISQEDLADALKELEGGADLVGSYNGMTWFDLCMSRLGDSVRQPGSTVSVLMRGDLHRANTTVDRLRKILTLPIPRHHKLPKETWRYCYVVNDDAVVYSPILGGRWKDELE